MPKLFQTKIEPRCTYCAKGQRLNDRQVVCPKKGVMDVTSHCRAFAYDPLRRTPPRAAKLELANLKEEDFAL